MHQNVAFPRIKFHSLSPDLTPVERGIPHTPRCLQHLNIAAFSGSVPLLCLLVPPQLAMAGDMAEYHCLLV